MYWRQSKRRTQRITISKARCHGDTMAGKKLDITEPDLPAKEGSEIEGTICLNAIGADGVDRPIFINKFDDALLVLTIEDAIRLFWFLDRAIPYVQDYNGRTEQ